MPTPLMNTVKHQYSYPRGSEWRKWDLQVHTPFSALNNGFGSDFGAYAKQLLEKAIEHEIAAVGITDYFTIQGYAAFRQLLNDEKELKKHVGNEVAEKANQILFLPNIELRTSIIVRDPKKGDSRVNFHVFFSDEVKPEDIEEHFLRELKFTAEANPDSKDERWALTTRNLAELGKRLKEQHAEFQKHSDLFVGMMNAVVDHSAVSEILENKPSIFKDRYLLCLPCDEDLSKCSWDGQGHLVRKVLIQKSHLLLSSNPGTRAFALGTKHATTEDFKAEFKGLKPCIHSSDSHNFVDMFEPKDNRHTWIKADPTFQGLCQILNEPEDRVFVGDVPPGVAKTERRSTRVVLSVDIRKTATATTTEKWFDCQIPLNSELIAIIGNKGSGKSALSDILGLLGNTPRYKSFSFLTGDKFRSSKNNKSKQFCAALKWGDGTVDKVPDLDVNPSADAFEKIKYIPQSYLEDICNEVGMGRKGRFYEELQDVIFSHVPTGEKLGFDKLDDLLEHLSKETTQAISQYVAEIRALNLRIQAIEEKLLPQYRNGIESQLAEKNREWDAHLLARPPEKVQPEADQTTQDSCKSVSLLLVQKQEKLKKIEDEIVALRNSDAMACKKRASAEKVISKLKNLEHQVNVSLSDIKSELACLNINLDEVVTFEVKCGCIETAILAFDKERSDIAAKLDPEVVTSSEYMKKIIITKIGDLQAQLSAPLREYQVYLESVKTWQQEGRTIQGSEEMAGTICYLKKKLAELSDLPAALRQLSRQRERKLLEVFREKQKLCTYYARYYGAVQDFLKNHELATSDQFTLTFNVAIKENGFANRMLSLINRRRTGSFMGEDEGNAEMKRLLDSANFNSALGVLRFTKIVLNKLTKREGRPLLLRDQLRQGASVQEVYDFIFSLDYLAPIYSLLWDGKGMEQLSPGERGNLLLIFYLLVDKNDIPLIIDQPEENLDNQTVYKTLVPCIKYAKMRRQLVIVTHNPNLAVVCDAEQIICAEMMKGEQNEIRYTCGSIENPVINQKIVDVLEGTRPAFDKRDDKYIQRKESL